MTKRKRPQLRVRSHYIVVGGQRVEIDPVTTDLPDRCKLAIAEMATGRKYELKEAIAQ